MATAGDADLVRAISAAAYVPAYQAVIGAVPRPASEDYASRIGGRSVWVAELAGEACGVLVLEAGPGFLLVYSVAVDPRHQGKGVGRALLAHAERCAEAKGVPELRLYTNRRMRRNVALYASCGFVEVGERPHPSRPGEVLIDMAKSVEGRLSPAGLSGMRAESLPRGLGEALEFIVGATASATAPCWIIGSAAMALHGLRLPVADVDLLLAPHDAVRLLRERGLPRLDDGGDGLFSSEVFGRWTDVPLPVEVMGGLQVLRDGHWVEVRPSTRVMIERAGGAMFVPSVAELAAIARLMGRPKDLARAKLLDALGQQSTSCEEWTP